jgi:glutaconate CoA-transferase subunit B
VSGPEYTPGEIMVAAAAREIADGEVVFVGMRLPLLAFILAKATHAPNAVGVFENGVLRDRPAPGPMITMADLANQCGALATNNLAEVMTMLSGGRVNLGFIGGAQVDLMGNVNTHRVNRPDGGLVRLPGSGGGADIACLAGRLLIIMDHQPHRLVERVDYITSPGWGPEPGWRQDQGLTRGGPSALITSLGIFRFEQGKAVLNRIHPGVSLDTLIKRTGFTVSTSADLVPTEAPTQQQLEIIRKYDPSGFWTG